MTEKEYNEKCQKLKASMEKLLASDREMIDHNTKMINLLLRNYGNDNPEKTQELLSLKMDNEDSLAIITSLESMLKNRQTADGISRVAELIHGYSNFFDLIHEDLDRIYQGSVLC